MIALLAAGFPVESGSRYQDAEKVRQQPQTVPRDARDMRERRDVDRLDSHLDSHVSLV